MTPEPAPYRFWPRRISWLTVAFALLAIGTFLAISRPGMQYITPMATMGGGVSYSGHTEAVPPMAPMPSGMPMRDASVSNSMAQEQYTKGSAGYYPAPYYDQGVPVTDTREFLKVNYNSSMRTRDVQGLTRRVETTVRGYSGRIDNESSSPQYGYVSFVIPMSKYDAFRTELEGLVDSRFLTINISSQNLLPQKQNIEEQQKQADTTLADYKTARQKIVSAHASKAASLQKQIDADALELTSLGAQVSTSQLQAQIQALSNEWSSLKQQLANENASYSSQLKNADANIAYAQDWQKAVQTQDQNLLDNVATVSGNVSIQWISLWDAAQLYLPGYWIPAIFAALTLLSLLNDRRRFGPHITTVAST